MRVFASTYGIPVRAAKEMHAVISNGANKDMHVSTGLCGFVDPIWTQQHFACRKPAIRSSSLIGLHVFFQTRTCAKIKLYQCA